MMYDTVRLFYPCNGTNLFRQLGDLVEVTACDPYGEKYVTGRLQNLKVTVNPYGVRIDGSLCKWHFGENYTPLDRTSTREAIETLSDHFNLNFAESIIKRLDVGVNLPMQYEPAAYFDYLGDRPRYKKFIYPTAVLYSIKAEQICFYDKMRETADKNGVIPNEYAGKNLLRCETRILTNPSKILQVQELAALDLWSAPIWNRCADYLQRQYGSIKKYEQSDSLAEAEYMNIQELYSASIMSHAEKFGGVEGLMAAIKRAQQQGKLDKCKAKRFRDRIAQAAEEVKNRAEEQGQPRSCIIQELTGKIQEAVEEYKV